MSSRNKHRAAESQADLFDLEYLYGLKKDVMDGCMEVNLIANESVCQTCGVKLVLTERDRSDGYSWVCRKFGVNAHHVRRTVRKDSWFDESKLSIPEILILTYWWAVASHFMQKNYILPVKNFFNASCDLAIPIKLA
ncbi:hypothetical protein AVEN_152094-1 [Araneus ventricosus]|uniref:Uncharacterized protein n=1 Tax=Araneus ventricosus TaxID=182803 RepID=A0A4Y2WLI3_ARAVE|nr:hypothetical protein AVEN_152094-1 [Araneus ventricosus]